MTHFDVEFTKLTDLVDAALRDSAEQAELETFGIYLDSLDTEGFSEAEYHLLAPIAGLDAVTRPRIAVWVETFDDLRLHGVYEVDLKTSPTSPDYLRELGKMWQDVGDALEGGDGTIPWSGEVILESDEA